MPTTRHMMIGLESTWNTPVTPNQAFELIREDVQFEPEYIRLATARSKGVNKLIKGFGLIRGTCEILLSYQDIAVLLTYFTGNVDTTGTGPFTHTVPGASGLGERSPLTLEIQRDSAALTWVYSGALITGIQLQLRTNDMPRAIITWIAASEVIGVAQTPTYLAQDFPEPPIISVEVSGASVDATEFNINMSWPVDEPNVLGNATLARKPEDSDVLSITGDFTVLFEALASIYTPFAADTEITQLEVHMPSGGDEDLTILMDQAKFLQATPHVDGRARQLQAVSFEAYGDGVAGHGDSPIGIVIINDDTAIPE